MSALYSGVSGMLAHQTRMDVIGDNIANAGTIGFKSARVLFADTFYSVLEPASGPGAVTGGINPSTVGQGVHVAGIQQNFGQGALQGTGRSLDVAVEGDGFIAVTDGRSIYYTRSGALTVDPLGNLVHAASGMRVVGMPADAAANGAVSPTSTLQLPVGQTSIARATGTLTLGGNLDSRLEEGASYQVTTQVYDSLGNAHDVTVTFTRSATPGAWDVTATSPDGELQIGPPAQVTFGEDGQLTSGALTAAFNLTDAGGAAPTVDMTLSLNGMTALAQGNSAALVSQDGFPPGTFSGVAIRADGTIEGIYSNGLTSPVGRIVTASFPNTGGLQNVGNSLYLSTPNSGLASYGVPGQDGRGALRSGTLESSNVDLTREFADMIVTQRGYQANSRVISVADQMLQEVLNLNR